MNKTKIYILLFGLLNCFPAFSEVLIDEDFSAFSAGTEDNPTKTQVVNTSTYDLLSGMTKTEGWTGYCVYQGGGCAALVTSLNSEGETEPCYISTPEMNMAGEIVVTFRAKRLSGSATTKIWVALCDNDAGPEDSKYFSLTDNWTEYTFTTTKAPFTDRTIIQFTEIDGSFLLDDVKIERTRSILEAPTPNAVQNISDTEALLSWQGTDTASDYILNVYRREMPEQQISGSVHVDFNSVNCSGNKINTSNPNFPEGWSIDVSSNGSTDVKTESDGTKYICFDAAGDYIETPEMPAPISKFSFFVKPNTMTTESGGNFTLLGVSICQDGVWTRISAIPNFWLTKDGDYYKFEGDILQFNTTKMRLECIQKNNVSFYIRDINIEYQTKTVPVSVITDKTVSATSYRLTDIDPKYDYYFYVKGHQGSLYSDDTAPVLIDGLVGRTPIALEATEVSNDAFTANWKKQDKATNYIITVDRTVTASTEALSNVEVLHEDFHNATGDDETNPTTSGYSQIDLNEAGFTDTQWIATEPQWANGMVGSQGDVYGSTGLVVTPKISLNHNNGKFKVKVRAYLANANDRLYIMLLDKLTATSPLSFKYIAGSSEPGFIEGTVDMTKGGENQYVAFMTNSGKAFLLDEVSIYQDLPLNETITAPYCIRDLDDVQSYKMENLDNMWEYTYSVIAYRTVYFADYKSNASNKVTVELSTSGVEKVADSTSSMAIDVQGNTLYISGAEPFSTVEVYNLQGIKLAVGTADSNGHCALSAPRGVTFVRNEGKTKKLIIK
jgi:hypothetical protein